MSQPQNAPAAENSPGQQSPLAQVFQDAYQKAVMIRRLDEQISQLATRRKNLADELRTIQSHLNEEFTRLLDVETPMPEAIPQMGIAGGNGARVSVSVNPAAFTAGRAAEAVA